MKHTKIENTDKQHIDRKDMTYKTGAADIHTEAAAAKEHTETDSSYLRAALDVAETAGEIMLSSGAEIFRVEETIEYISNAYGIHNSNHFVLSSGIFLTAYDQKEKVFARVRHIPLSSARLDRVAAVNQLSREIVEGKHDPYEAKSLLNDIRSMPGKSKTHQILASGIGSGCFCFLFGGDLMDSIAAFICGFLLYFYLLYIIRGKLSKIALNITGGALVTMLSILFKNVGFGHHMAQMIIGAVIPLVPGVPFTNSVRDIMNEDYIAGIVRLLDTLVITFSIAAGVGFIMVLYYQLFGGQIV